MTEAVIGKYYSVPAVKVISWHGFKGWLPIIGPKHEDAEIVGFPWEHYHIDWRFAPKSVFQYLCGHRAGPGYVYAYPIQTPDGRGNPSLVGGPETRRMLCKRELPQFPIVGERGTGAWVHKLREAFCGASITKGVCPHRGIPVSAMIREGDVLTCPGHGLQFNATTGEALTARTSSSVTEGK